MKKTFGLLLVMIMSVLALTGCGKTTETDTSSKTPATILSKEFETIANSEKDVLTMAQKVAENDIFQTKMAVEERTNEDYLEGFDKEIKNFSKAAVIKPIIGSIPFIAYVFETNNTTELAKELNANANPRWNICVEADETKVVTVGDYLFFVMSPSSFEEYGV